MRRVRKIVCSVVIGFAAFAAVLCCCTTTVAQAFAADHGCCPKNAKADSASHEQCAQCQHQLSQATQIHPDTYVSNILEKSNPLYAATQHFVAVAFALPVLSLAPNGPPQGKQTPLYLQSHNLRL